MTETMNFIAVVVTAGIVIHHVLLQSKIRQLEFRLTVVATALADHIESLEETV
jgi:hypothetical protein